MSPFLQKKHNPLRAERICCRVQAMISTVRRGQILISDEQIRKQKWLVCVPRLCSGNTSLNSQRSPRRRALPWEMSWKFSAQQGKPRYPRWEKEGIGHHAPAMSNHCLHSSVNSTNARDRVPAGRPALVLNSRRVAGAAAISPAKQPG